MLWLSESILICPAPMTTPRSSMQTGRNGWPLTLQGPLTEISVHVQTTCQSRLGFIFDNESGNLICCCKQWLYLVSIFITPLLYNHSTQHIHCSCRSKTFILDTLRKSCHVFVQMQRHDNSMNHFLVLKLYWNDALWWFWFNYYLLGVLVSVKYVRTYM